MSNRTLSAFESSAERNGEAVVAQAAASVAAARPSRLDFALDELERKRERRNLVPPSSAVATRVHVQHISEHEAYRPGAATSSLATSTGNSSLFTDRSTTSVAHPMQDMSAALSALTASSFLSNSVASVGNLLPSQNMSARIVPLASHSHALGTLLPHHGGDRISTNPLPPQEILRYQLLQSLQEQERQRNFQQLLHLTHRELVGSNATAAASLNPNLFSSASSLLGPAVSLLEPRVNSLASANHHLLNPMSSTSAYPSNHSATGRTAARYSTLARLPAIDTPSVRLPVNVSHPSDRAVLSDHQVYLRQQMEVFCATRDDINAHVRGRNKRLYVGQVGIRCRHCTSIPIKQRQMGSAYFPLSLMGFYQAGQNMLSTHLQCGKCSELPDDVKNDFIRLLTFKNQSSTAGRQYWADRLSQLGLVDTDKGVFLVRDVPLDAEVIAMGSGIARKRKAVSGDKKPVKKPSSPL